jgi:hypothetical protein
LRTRPPEIMPTINHFFTENKWIKISLNLNPPEASLDYWLYDNHSSQLTFFFLYSVWNWICGCYKCYDT